MSDTNMTTPPTDEDLLCPLCEYNLRGLAEARCPECGYRTTWEELRTRPPLHRYLCEHHPKRNFVTFVGTVIGTLLPRRFCRSVQPTMVIRPGRLFVFAIIVLLLATMGVLTGVTGDLMDLSRGYADIRASQVRYVKTMLT